MPAETNPYAPPNITQEIIPALALDPSLISVEGQFLVVQAEAVLPSRCVLTNEPLDETSQVTAILKWVPKRRFVWRSQQCQLTHSVNPDWNRRRRRSWIMESLFYIAVFAGIAWYDGEIIPYFVMLIALLAQSYVKSKQSPLQIKSSSNGLYWIGGCGDSFLEQCKDEYGAYQASDWQSAHDQDES